MRHCAAIESGRRRVAAADGGRSTGAMRCGARGALRATGSGPFQRVHAGRYFGGLWFKVFSERGPC